MKQSLTIILSILLLNGMAQDSFKIRIKLNNPENYPLQLSYSHDHQLVIDTNARVEKDYLVFTGKVKEPVVARLLMPRNPALSITISGGVIPGPTLQFFLSNEVITISGNANTLYAAKVTGGRFNAEWKKIRVREALLDGDTWKATKKAFENSTDSAAQRELSRTYQEYSTAKMQLQKKFMEENPNALLSMYLLSTRVPMLSYEELKDAFDKLGPAHKQHAYGQSIATTLEKLANTAKGSKAVPINKKDINGNPVNLETLRGKYVLIDFWGSWCGPCRASHPHLKELYSKYKNDGFEIVGVAYEHGTFEASRKSWEKAVAADGLPWIQVLNNEDVEQFDAVKEYGISAFPTKILLNKEGIVIARYVGEDERFDEKLKEIFGK